MTNIDPSYPILVEDVGELRSWRGTGSTPLATTVEQALRAVLGWRPRTDDPKSFVASITNAFSITPFEGRTEVRWQQRNYAATITADLGAVTGAQASLLNRAKSDVDAALALLVTLKSIRPGESDEYVNSLSAVVKQTLEELVDEFAYLGGPRANRVDALFVLLIGTPLPNAGAPDPDSSFDDFGLALDGQLRNLGTQLGLNSTRVNSVAQEETFTAFVTVCDYVRGLFASWLRFKDSDEPWFGTTLVLVQRQLTVISETVEEVRLMMDAVFFGADERAAVTLSSAGFTTLTVEGLLDWISDTATREGPRLVTDAGKDGANSLETLVRAQSAAVIALADDGGLPAAARRAHVRRALTELSGYLDRIAVLLGDVGESPAVRINPIDPDLRDLSIDPDAVRILISLQTDRVVDLLGAQGLLDVFRSAPRDVIANLLEPAVISDDQFTAFLELPRLLVDRFVTSTNAARTRLLNRLPGEAARLELLDGRFTAAEIDAFLARSIADQNPVLAPGVLEMLSAFSPLERSRLPRAGDPNNANFWTEFQRLVQ